MQVSPLLFRFFFPQPSGPLILFIHLFRSGFKFALAACAFALFFPLFMFDASRLLTSFRSPRSLRSLLFVLVRNHNFSHADVALEYVKDHSITVPILVKGREKKGQMLLLRVGAVNRG